MINLKSTSFFFIKAICFEVPVFLYDADYNPSYGIAQQADFTLRMLFL